jgi:hypothetical protein
VPPRDIPLSWPDVYWGFLKHRPNAVVPMVRCHFVPRKSPRGLFCSFHSQKYIFESSCAKSKCMGFIFFWSARVAAFAYSLYAFPA